MCDWGKTSFLTVNYSLKFHFVSLESRVQQDTMCYLLIPLTRHLEFTTLIRLTSIRLNPWHVMMLRSKAACCRGEIRTSNRCFVFCLCNKWTCWTLARMAFSSARIVHCLCLTPWVFTFESGLMNSNFTRWYQLNPKCVWS